MLSRPSKALASLSSTTRVTATATAIRASFSTAPKYDWSSPNIPKNSLITGEEGVHQTMKTTKSWRNKPLFRRQGDVRFKTGMEASNLLVREALRRDAHEEEYIESLTATLQCLSPIFDRNPKYAFVAKTLIEPERFLQFRVAWIDDLGINRLNRGWRVQYSSALGPYSGSLHFGPHMNHSVVHCLGFDQVFANAVTGFPRGSAVGGSDFNPLDKSEGELQRFCQSYMTELANYVGSDQDFPWMGRGVGQKERNGIHVWSIQGNYLTNAEQLFDMKVFIHFILTTIPITSTLTDASGHVYEPDGITEHKLSTIDHMKDERGAPLGRYTMSSTTAQFNKPKACLIFHAMSSFVVEICTKLMKLLSMQPPVWDASSSWKAVKYMSLQPPASSSRIEVIYMQLIP